MAIFSRRCVQGLLDRARPLLKDAYQKHLGRLNVRKISTQRITEVLSVEWELAVLVALDSLGQVTYEAPPGKLSDPDVLFESSQNDLKFLADITTVSDQNHHKDNPVEEFQRELLRRASKHNIHTHRLSYHIEGEEVEAERRALRHNSNLTMSLGPKLRPITKDVKMRLRLPKKDKMFQFVKTNFTPFFEKVSQSPEVAHSLIIDNANAGVSLEYNPNQKYLTGRWLSYTVTHSPDRNPVHRALEDKRKQLSKSGFRGMRGVFLCDGDCQLLKDDGSGGASLSMEEVLWYFGRRKHNLDFVFVLSVHQENPPVLLPGAGPVRGTVAIWTSDAISAARPYFEWLAGVLSKSLPPVKRTPANARTLVARTNGCGDSSFQGGGTVTNESITISSRAFHMFLAGEVDYERFCNENPVVKPRGNENIFRTMLRRGRLIKSVRVQECPTEDDDWVTIEFGLPDPAISSYR